MFQCASKITKCSRLVQLYLYSNKLESIPDMTGLNSLKVLWLSGNEIEEIKVHYKYSKTNFNLIFFFPLCIINYY